MPRALTEIDRAAGRDIGLKTDEAILKAEAAIATLQQIVDEEATNTTKALEDLGMPYMDAGACIAVTLNRMGKTIGQVLTQAYIINKLRSKPNGR